MACFHIPNGFPHSRDRILKYVRMNFSSMVCAIALFAWNLYLPWPKQNPSRYLRPANAKINLFLLIFWQEESMVIRLSISQTSNSPWRPHRGTCQLPYSLINVASCRLCCAFHIIVALTQNNYCSDFEFCKCSFMTLYLRIWWELFGSSKSRLFL